jgi:hypothetical protein
MILVIKVPYKINKLIDLTLFSLILNILIYEFIILKHFLKVSVK